MEYFNGPAFLQIPQLTAIEKWLRVKQSAAYFTWYCSEIYYDAVDSFHKIIGLHANVCFIREWLHYDIYEDMPVVATYSSWFRSGINTPTWVVTMKTFVSWLICVAIKLIKTSKNYIMFVSYPWPSL
jgi:hypothetical protein